MSIYTSTVHMFLRFHCLSLPPSIPCQTLVEAITATAMPGDPPLLPGELLTYIGKHLSFFNVLHWVGGAWNTGWAGPGTLGGRGLEHWVGRAWNTGWAGPGTLGGWGLGHWWVAPGMLLGEQGPEEGGRDHVIATTN